MAEKCGSCDSRAKAKGLCRRHYNQEWRKTNKARVAAYNKEWRESHPDYDFNSWRQLDPGKYLQYYKSWRESNVESVRTSYRAWRENHKEQEKARGQRRRALTSGATATLTFEQWQETWVEFGGMCFWCEKTATDLEHIVPLSPRPGGQQGHHTKTNTVPACRPCNSRKLNKDPLVFLFEMRQHATV